MQFSTDVQSIMPKAKLWSFTRVGNGLYLKSQDEVKESYGPVTEVRPVKDQPEHIKVCKLK